MILIKCCIFSLCYVSLSVTYSIRIIWLLYICVCVCLVTQLCLTLCDPLELQPTRLLCPWGFSRQKYWSGLSCPPPGDLPNPGIEPRSPTLQANSLLTKPARNPNEYLHIGMLLLLLSQFSHVWPCATPETAAHQAPPSLGLSGQE